MEKETLEMVLYELRKKEDWTYLQVVEKLENQNISEKNIKKWEAGLEYPDTDTIYKLSEIYQIPAVELLKAKNKSMEIGMNSIHYTFIKWMGYILGISIYSSVWLSRIVLGLALIGALMYFVGNCEEAIKAIRRNRGL